MYKIAVLGDRDSVLGFKALGLDTHFVETTEEARTALHRLAKEDYAIIYITEQLAQNLTADINKYKDSSLTDLVGMLDDVLPMVTTNMTKSQITTYVKDLFPMLGGAEIVTQRIPVDGGYYDARIDGMAVLVPDREMNIQALVDSLT